jgi:uncharacterized Tic20 family protein
MDTPDMIRFRRHRAANYSLLVFILLGATALIAKILNILGFVPIIITWILGVMHLLSFITMLRAIVRAGDSDGYRKNRSN